MTHQVAVGIAIQLVAIGAMIDACETLWIRREFSGRGLYNWHVLRTSYAFTASGPLSHVLDRLFLYPNVLVLVVLEAAAAVPLVFHGPSPASTVMLCLVLGTRLLAQLRNQFGLDGADQMRIIVLASCLAWRIVGPLWAKEACLWFVTLQAVLSYEAAGIAKLVSPVWRGGTAVRDIVRTSHLGNRSFFLLLSRYPRLSWTACWGTIVFECATPILVFCGPKLCVVFLAAGLAFHLSIALIMGLNDFVWTFVATYPLIYVCSVDFAALLKN